MDRDAFALAARRRRGRSAGMAAALLLAFVAGIVVMAAAAQRFPRFLQRSVTPVVVTAPQPSAPIQVQPMAQSALPAAAMVDALTVREAALAARIAFLEAQSAAIDSDARAASGNATRAEALLVAFAARRALDRGLGLGYIAGQLRARFGATQPRAVAVVVAASRQPVTIQDLRSGLDQIGDDLMTDAGDAPWWRALEDSVSNLVVIHKTGSPSPHPSDRLARAHTLLDGGQVEAALAEVSRLPGADKAQAWTTAARRYIASRQALDLLENAAIMGDAQAPPPAPGVFPVAPAPMTGAPAQ